MNNRVVICVSKMGLPLGRCVSTPSQGWKFYPMTGAHQPSRKFWGSVEDCLPPWVDAQRDSCTLMTPEDYNVMYPQFALKTGTSLPLTSPATILGMMSPALQVSEGNPLWVKPEVDLRKALQDLIIEVTSLKLRMPGSAEVDAPLWEKLEAAQAALKASER